MRYFITLLVVLSFVASFGFAELQSTKSPGEDSFRLSTGLATHFTFPDFEPITISPHLGIAYGFSDNFSLGLKTNVTYLSHGFLLFIFDLSAKASYPFPDSPFALSGSLGGELMYSLLLVKSNLTFQAWFAYVGVTLHSSLTGALPAANLGVDIEFNDNLNLLFEVGYSFFAPYAAAIVEFNL